MVGGHGTAAAFGPLLESIGLDGGATISVAAATFGLVAGGVIGGPIGEELVHKFHLVSSAESERFDPSFNAGTVSKLKAVAGNKERAENAIKIENKIGQRLLQQHRPGLPWLYRLYDRRRHHPQHRRLHSRLQNLPA